MTNEAEGKERVRGRLRMALAAIAVLVLLLVVPPLISVNHYRARITQLISQSLGRPVRLSAVQMRLLPTPGFELSDLSVAEDPAYGAEPVLHANKVVASIRLLALLRGRIEIGKISVDEASLNLVRAGPGRWNLDPLFRTAAAKAEPESGKRRSAPLPYLEATNSRIDFKDGAEKLPFSLVNADLSFWQENPGDWRIRLRAQPARTDVSLYQEETGVVRMEASVGRASALRLMPLHLDLDWRQAELGQLARLITGSDSGWRGDVTGELHLSGTADAAQITMRLRAAGVHRAEFTPASLLDFDANCALVYHYALHSLQNLACDSPLGDGHIHVTGEKPGADAPPQFSVALDHIPIAAGLDALRTLRSGLAPDLEAAGNVSGKIVYAVAPPSNAEPPRAPSLLQSSAEGVRSHKTRGSRESRSATGPLTGSLTISGFSLTGSSLTRPIQTSKITLEPVAVPPAPRDEPVASSQQALAGTFTVPAGGAVPLTFNVQLSLVGYRVGVRGPISIPRGREIAHAAGIPQTQMLDSLAGDPVAVNLTAAGPWLAPEQFSLPGDALPQSAPSPAPQPQSPELSAVSYAIPATDTLTGTVTLRNANWKAGYLAGHVLIADATMHLENGDLRWDPVAFSYGPLKGNVSLTVPLNCPADQLPPQSCPTQFQLHFAELDAAAVENALLGARQKDSLLSDLIQRFHPSTAPPWPRLEGVINADSAILGPVTLQHLSVAVQILPASAEITSLNAVLLGGGVTLTGTLLKPATDQDKPAYSLEGAFQSLSAASLGQLLGLRWTGGPISGSGKVELSGYTGKDLATSAKGTLQFDARRGAIAALATSATRTSPAALRNAPPVKDAGIGDAPQPSPVPIALTRFDRFTGNAEIANGAITLGQNQVISGSRKRPVEAVIIFADPPKVTFSPSPKVTPVKLPR